MLACLAGAFPLFSDSVTPSWQIRRFVNGKAYPTSTVLCWRRRHLSRDKELTPATRAREQVVLCTHLTGGGVGFLGLGHSWVDGLDGMLGGRALLTLSFVRFGDRRVCDARRQGNVLVEKPTTYCLM